MYTIRNIIFAFILGVLVCCVMIVAGGQPEGIPGGGRPAKGNELVFDVSDGQLIHIVPVGADLGTRVRSDTNNFLIVPLPDAALKTWLLNEIKELPGLSAKVKLPVWDSYPLTYTDTNGVTKMRRKANVAEIKKQLSSGGKITDAAKAMPRDDVVILEP